MRISKLLLLPLCLSTVACKKAPPEAPTELSELAGFLFERMWDEEEDSDDLYLGVDNLIQWLGNNEASTAEGYAVLDLDESVIESVNPNRNSDLGSVGGASVSAQIFHPVKPIARALVVDEQEDIFDAYKEHERTYFGDPLEFMDHTLDRITTDNNVESKFAGILTTKTKSRAQFRWVELESGEYAFLHRTWLTAPAEVSPNLAEVEEQLYFGITVPWEGHALRLGTTWIAAEIVGGVVDEDGAMNIMINSMRTEAETLDVYLD